MKGTGAGIIDDTALPIRPRPCTCPCTDPKYGTPKPETDKATAKNPVPAGDRPRMRRGCQEQDQETESGKQKRRTSGSGPLEDGIPPPRDPGQPPQPNTEDGPGSGNESAPHNPDPGSTLAGTTPTRASTPGGELDADPDQGAVGLRAAIDPHDGCRKCGGGGSARATPAATASRSLPRLYAGWRARPT